MLSHARARGIAARTDPVKVGTALSCPCTRCDRSSQTVRRSSKGRRAPVPHSRPRPAEPPLNPACLPACPPACLPSCLLPRRRYRACANVAAIRPDAGAAGRVVVVKGVDDDRRPWACSDDARPCDLLQARSQKRPRYGMDRRIFVALDKVRPSGVRSRSPSPPRSAVPSAIVVMFGRPHNWIKSEKLDPKRRGSTSPSTVIGKNAGG
jgi:hypothetical protein